MILFKDGLKSDLYSYIVLSMLRKILVGILDNRLWDAVNEYVILKKNQTEFRKGYRTTDHILNFTYFEESHCTGCV